MSYPCCADWPLELQHGRHITIRPATPEERKSVGGFWATGKPMKAKKYVVCDVEKPDVLLGAFGMVDGGNTRAEAVFWAERLESKNDLGFIRPPGWDNVVGDLPEDKP